MTPDTGNRIGAITVDGRIVEWDIPTSGAAPIGVTRGPGGDIWFTETGTLTDPGEKIGRIVGARGQLTAALRSGHERHSRPSGASTSPERTRGVRPR
jgi:streptogramin lyase